MGVRSEQVEHGSKAMDKTETTECDTCGADLDGAGECPACLRDEAYEAHVDAQIEATEAEQRARAVIAKARGES